MPDLIGPRNGTVAERISEILKFDAERAEDTAERLQALGIRSSQDKLRRLGLAELCNAGLTELEAIKLRARWIPDEGKEKMTLSREAHIQVLEECKPDLKSTLVVDAALIKKLRENQVLTEDEIRKIENAPRNDVKVNELVNALLKEGDKYMRFLRNLDQQQAIDMLKQKENDLKLERMEADRQRTEFVLLKKIDDISRAKDEKSEMVSRLEIDKSDLGVRLKEMQNELDETTKKVADFTKKYIFAQISAAKHGDLKSLKEIIDPGRDINADLDEEDKTSLIWACSIGNTDMVKYLLEMKSDPEHPDKEGNRALHYASKDGMVDTMEILLEHGADPNVQNERLDTPLHVAAFKQQTRAVELLLSKKANVNAGNKTGCTALYLAAKKGNVDLIKVLHNHGADINAGRGDDQSTALHVAVEMEKLEVVQYLLDNGADPFIPKMDMIAPLHVAAEIGSVPMCQILLEESEDVKSHVDIQKDNKATPLHCAAAGNHTEVMKYLHQHGADLEAKKLDQSTPLFSAAYKGGVGAVKLLLSLGAFINATKPDGETPLLTAIQNEKPGVVKALLDDLHVRTDLTYTNGDTVLHIAAKVRNKEIVEQLLAAKPEIHIKDNVEGKKPYDMDTTSEIRDLLVLREKRMRQRVRTHSEGSNPPYQPREHRHSGCEGQDSFQE